MGTIAEDVGFPSGGYSVESHEGAVLEAKLERRSTLMQLM